EIDRNLLQVAHAGRAPGLKLLRLGEKVCLHDWAREVLVEMTPVAELLDQAYGNEARSKALMAQLKKIDDPDQTPSARLLADMRANDESFYDIANRLSRHHTRYYRNQQPELQFKEQVEAVIAESVQAQQVIDAREEVDFDTFLAAYQAS
ncbi:MAG: glutamate--cysteine ligase, partial [bacterium]